MPRGVLFLFTLVICLDFAAMTASAQTKEEARAQQFKTQVANLPMGTTLRVHLKDGRDLQGQLSARTDETFEITAPGPVTIAYGEVKSMKQAGAQSSTASYHALSHHTKVFLIMFAAGALLLIWAGVELGKS